VPARNFTIGLAERVRAMGGPPAWMVRKKTIEDIEADFLDRLEEALATSEAAAQKVLGTLRIDKLNELIAQHNRYYPIEANLPMSAITSDYLELGKPWRPHPGWTAETLLARARDESA
jgi:hypothetical protein